MSNPEQEARQARQAGRYGKGSFQIGTTPTLLGIKREKLINLGTQNWKKRASNQASDLVTGQWYNKRITQLKKPLPTEDRDRITL
jgi:hypothetical protein